MQSRTAIDERAAKVRLVIFDVDGVLTNGGIQFSDRGEELKTFDAHDGLGIKLLIESGIEGAIITGHTSPIIYRRAEYLGIKHLYCGYHDKLPAYQELMKTLDLQDEQVAYIGDDLPDIAIIRRVGLGVAVANADDLVKEHAIWHTTRCGGQGAARELCELIMRAQKTWHTTIEKFLQ